jgi:hypothetical protein
MGNAALGEVSGFLEKIWQANSAETLLLVGLGMVVWLIGGNILVAWHYRRLGKSAWSGLKPFAFPFKDFNSREWTILAALAITSLVLFGLALGWE